MNCPRRDDYYRLLRDHSIKRKIVAHGQHTHSCTDVEIDLAKMETDVAKVGIDIAKVEVGVDKWCKIWV